MAETDQVTPKSGRRVAVHWLAQSDGQRTVVFCHPAPGAGTLDPDPIETAKRRVTLLAVDRPGYGGSEPVSGDRCATVASAADDVAEVLERVGIERVGIAGWSSGGRWHWRSRRGGPTSSIGL